MQTDQLRSFLRVGRAQPRPSISVGHTTVLSFCSAGNCKQRAEFAFCTFPERLHNLGETIQKNQLSDQSWRNNSGTVRLDSVIRNYTAILIWGKQRSKMGTNKLNSASWWTQITNDRLS